MNTFWLSLFVGCNIGIMLGYVFVAIFIAPKISVELVRTKVGGIWFFVTCAFTHAEMASHALFSNGLSLNEMLSVHMLVIHLTQVVAVWLFVSGLYVEFVSRKITLKKAFNLEDPNG